MSRYGQEPRHSRAGLVVLGLVSAPFVGLVVLVMVGMMMIASSGEGGSTASASVPAGGVTGSTLSPDAPILPAIRALIAKAIKDEGCPALTESVLAAQLYQESRFNADARSPVGAQGIAQFMPGTWPGYGRDENGDGKADPFDPEDAIPAAARYDCAIAKIVARVPGDAAQNMLAAYNAGPGAVLRYNGVPPYEETQAYVRIILAKAKEWAVVPTQVGSGTGDDAPSRPSRLPDAGSGKVERTGNKIIDTAVAWAVAQIGSWYQWGGTCKDPFGPPPGRCDCSSLMQQAYAHAGVALPRVAREQARVGDPVSPGEIQPGDLIAIQGSLGGPDRAGHIGMYVGSGMVVEAPYTGVQVRLVPARTFTKIVSIRRIVSG